MVLTSISNDDIPDSSFSPRLVWAADQVHVRAAMQKNFTNLDGNASIFRADSHHRHIAPEFCTVIH
jgi:hypothetical protein